jgi:flagellar secretion chaperone FliS
MKPHLAYKRQSQSAWNRIDMLLAIYDGTVQSLEAGLSALEREDAAELARHQLKATQLLVLILDGIDPDGGEVADQIRALCTFAIGQVGTLTADGWRNALDVVSTLREGFQEIREEAADLETQGVIPPLSHHTSGIDLTYS